MTAPSASVYRMKQRSAASAANAEDKSATKSAEKSIAYAEQHDIPHYSTLSILPVDFVDLERRRYYIADKKRFADVYKKRGLEDETGCCIVFVVIPETITKQSGHAVNFPDIQDLKLTVVRVPPPSLTALSTAASSVSQSASATPTTQQSKMCEVVTMNVVSYEFERPQRAVGLIVVEPPFVKVLKSMTLPLDLTV